MKTCLVVDDSSVIRKVARRILEGFDFQITEAEDGERALEFCQSKMPYAILLCGSPCNIFPSRIKLCYLTGMPRHLISWQSIF